MITNVSYNRLIYWIDENQSKGRLAFSLSELRQSFESDTETALKRMLDRLSEKGKIVSVFRGYYLIIPPQYSAKGILPAALFIDGLMQYLNRNYYVSLLSAAALHGAAHQQPQEYFIVTSYPTLRTTNKNGLKINYISKRQLVPETLTEKRKTEIGYITVSNSLLTAVDLINYEKRIGGLNRASTVINELTESIKPSMVIEDFINYSSASSLQRLGFILDEIMNKKEIAEKIFSLCKKEGIKFYQIPLKGSGSKNNSDLNEKWKIMVNTEIEIDE